MPWRKLEQVTCRCESRADQRPLRFRLKGQWFEVENILGEWLEQEAGSPERTWRIFEIQCPLGKCRLRTPLTGWFWEFACQEEPKPGRSADC